MISLPSKQVRTWTGIETEDYVEVINYTLPFNLIYNPDMSTYDENTIYNSGINTGSVNYMRVGEGSHNNRITILEFIHNVKKTNDHVDEAVIVGQVQIAPGDLRNLIKLLTDQANKANL